MSENDEKALDEISLDTVASLREAEQEEGTGKETKSTKGEGIPAFPEGTSQEYDVDDSYWRNLRLRTDEIVEDWDKDRKRTWNRTFYGALFFGIGFFILITATEYNPHWMAFIVMGGAGAFLSGWGMYVLAS